MSVIVPGFVENGGLIKPGFSPYAPVKLNRSNKFTKNLAVCVVPGSGDALRTVNLVNHAHPVSTTGAIRIDASPNGKELVGSAGALSFDITGVITSAQYTLFALMRRRIDLTANMAMLSIGSVGNANDRMALDCRGQTAGAPYNMFYKLGSTSLGIRQGSLSYKEFVPVFITRYSNTSTFLNIKGNAFSDSRNVGPIAIDRVAFMGHDVGGLWSATDMGLLIGALWSVPLSQNDIKHFMRDPFQVVEFT